MNEMDVSPWVRCLRLDRDSVDESALLTFLLIGESASEQAVRNCLLHTKPVSHVGVVNYAVQVPGVSGGTPPLWAAVRCDWRRSEPETKGRPAKRLNLKSASRTTFRRGGAIRLPESF
jgi:hypothetical protein